MNGPLDGLVVSGARDRRVAVDGWSKLTRPTLYNFIATRGLKAGA